MRRRVALTPELLARIGDFREEREALGVPLSMDGTIRRLISLGLRWEQEHAFVKTHDERDE